MKELAAELGKLQKRLETYEDKYLASTDAKERDELKASIEYYRTEAAKVRNALLSAKEVASG